jgi:hypothetical protein
VKEENEMTGFTEPAKEAWLNIPEETREKLLSNVHCTTCGEMTTIVKYDGQIRSGDLLLDGNCETCGDDVTRLIET